MGLQEGDAPVLLVLAGREQVGLLFIDVEQLLPLGPLWLAGGDLGVKALVDIADGDAILRLGNELALLPEHPLKVFDLREKIDDPRSNSLDDLHNLKPALGMTFAGGLDLI